MDTTIHFEGTGTRWWAAAACALVLCATDARADPMPVPAVIDLHVDLAYQLHAKKHAFDDASAPTSPARLAAGNVGVIVYPLFVGNAQKLTPQKARREYEALYADLQALWKSPAGQRSLLPPMAPAAPGKAGAVLSFEGADGFSDRPQEIVAWIERGACFVGLVHMKNNALAGSATDPDKKRRALGLTPAGKALAEIVVSHGGVLDAAHASDAAADDMIAIARAHGAPIVVTHTGLRALRPIDRNVDDAHILAVASTGGVVGIDIHSGHIGAQPGMTATLDDVIAHIEHAVSVGGIDHVAIGSDLEGGIEQPSDADGAATWPILEKKLADRGWNGESIEALFRANAARVLAWAREHGCGKNP
jgi:membrane dipeptidase